MPEDRISILKSFKIEGLSNYHTLLTGNRKLLDHSQHNPKREVRKECKQQKSATSYVATSKLDKGKEGIAFF